MSLCVKSQINPVFPYHVATQLIHATRRSTLQLFHPDKCTTHARHGMAGMDHAGAREDMLHVQDGILHAYEARIT